MPQGKKWSDSSIGQASTLASGDQFLIIQASTGQSKRVTQAILSSYTGNILTATLSLTAAQIKTLNSIPVVIVAAPGSGYALEAISATISFTWVGVAFSANSGIDIVTDSLSASAYQLTSGLNINTANSSRICRYIPYAGTTTEVVENKALTVTAGADSAAGNGTARVYLSYRIITL